MGVASSCNIIYNETKNTSVSVWSVWAAVTKCRICGGLNDKNVFSHSSSGSKSDIKVKVQLGFGKSPLPGLQLATFLQMAGFFLCLHRAEKERLQSSLVSPYKGTNSIMKEGSTLIET